MKAECLLEENSKFLRYKIIKNVILFFILERLLGRTNSFSAIPQKIFRISCKRSTLLILQVIHLEIHLFTNEDITLWKSGQQKVLRS